MLNAWESKYTYYRLRCKTDASNQWMNKWSNEWISEWDCVDEINVIKTILLPKMCGWMVERMRFANRGFSIKFSLSRTTAISITFKCILPKMPWTEMKRNANRVREMEISDYSTRMHFGIIHFHFHLKQSLFQF